MSKTELNRIESMLMELTPDELNIFNRWLQIALVDRDRADRILNEAKKRMPEGK